jgi:RimJ/RimL family protein N-acetyltransferase
MKTGDEFQQTVYGYWAKRFGREREEFTHPGTLVIQEKELAETGKAHLYRIDQLSLLRIDPCLAEQAGLPEGYHPDMGALTVGTLQASLRADLASTFLDYFLDPQDFKCFPAPENFITRRLHAEQDKPQLHDLYAACTEEELDLADIHVEEPDPVMYGMFAGEHLVAYAGHRYWDDVIADMGVLIHPDYRGQGLGKAIVSALCEWCLQNDVIPMYRVFSYNVHSCRLAESLGFKALVVIKTLESKTLLNKEHHG